MTQIRADQWQTLISFELGFLNRLAINKFLLVCCSNYLSDYPSSLVDQMCSLPV